MNISRETAQVRHAASLTSTRQNAYSAAKGCRAQTESQAKPSTLALPVPGTALTNPRGLLLSALLALDVATWLHTAVHGLNLIAS